MQKRSYKAKVKRIFSALRDVLDLVQDDVLSNLQKPAKVSGIAEKRTAAKKPKPRPRPGGCAEKRTISQKQLEDQLEDLRHNRRGKGVAEKRTAQVETRLRPAPIPGHVWVDAFLVRGKLRQGHYRPLKKGTAAKVSTRKGAPPEPGMIWREACTRTRGKRVYKVKGHWAFPKGGRSKKLVEACSAQPCASSQPEAGSPA